MGCSDSKSSSTKEGKANASDDKKEEAKKEETKKEETKKTETKKTETKKLKYEDLPEADRKKIEKAFNKADKNKNGSIDRKELLTVFFEPSQCNDPNFKPGEKVNAFIAEFDKNKDDKVTLEEFKEVIVNYPNRDELIKQLKK